MSTIVTRAGKGSALTHNEVDANFTNLNTDKIEAAQTVTLTNKTISGSDNTLSNIGNASLTNSSVTIGSTSVSLGSTATTVSGLTLSSPTVSGGTINNASVGATTPSTGSFTSLTDSGNLTFTGTGNRITGDFSNATLNNRVIFQSSLTNGNTVVSFAPSGSNSISALVVSNASDLTNASYGNLQANSATEIAIRSDRYGSGTYLPMTFYTGGSERMRIDTSGNVGIGTSSPSGKLNVQDSVAAGRANITLLNNAAGNTSNRMRIRMAASSGFSGTDLYPYIEAYEENAGNAAEGLAFGTYNGTSLGERMRIDSSGNVGIGTSSPTTIAGYQSLTVNGSTSGLISIKYNGTDGGYLYADSSSFNIDGKSTTPNVVFKTNGSERARIDSSGNLLVGRSTQVALEKFVVEGNVSNWLVRFKNDNTSNPQGLELSYSSTVPNSTDRPFLFCVDQTTLRMSVRSNGGIANFSGNNVNLSDRREKTNFAPAGEYLSKICAIPVQTFNYIDQNHEEDPGLTLGVVAQDVQAVAPELVMESNWGTEEEPKMRLSIYQTDLQYALMKCIQEQQAMIEELKAKVAALENK